MRRCHRPRHRHSPPPTSRPCGRNDAPATAAVRPAAARGAAELVESIHDFDPLNLLPMPEASLRAREEMHRPVRELAEAPSEGPAESVGRFVGKVGPTLLIPGIGAESALGQVAERVAAGAIAGGLPPTTEHTVANHLSGALAGAGTAGILSGGAQLGGATLRSIAGASPLVRFGAHALIVPPLAHAIHSSTGLPYDYSYDIAAAVAWGLARRGVMIPGQGGPTTSGAALGRIAGGTAGAATSAIKAGRNGQQDRAKPAAKTTERQQ